MMNFDLEVQELTVLDVFLFALQVTLHLIYTSASVISNYLYLKVNFLVPENLL